MFCLGLFVCSQSGGHHPSQDVEKVTIIPSKKNSMANCHFLHTTKFIQNSFKIH
jgi:hypothetical protein